jgi:hypoxanthine phosphoribosyltransferase
MKPSLLTPPEVEEVVFSEDDLAATVCRLAGEIARDHSGASIHLVGVLKGALFFLADLARALPTPLDARLDTISVSSYGNLNRSSGEVRLLKDTTESVEGKHVVIVDDIVDNGLTLDYLQNLFRSRKPASLRTCVLLNKPFRRQITVPLDYVGLACPDTFVVGYGLDYQEKYRNLPYVAKLAPSAFDTTG